MESQVKGEILSGNVHLKKKRKKKGKCLWHLFFYHTELCVARMGGSSESGWAHFIESASNGSDKWPGAVRYLRFF